MPDTAYSRRMNSPSVTPMCPKRNMISRGVLWYQIDFFPLCSAIAQHYPTLTLAKYFQGEKLQERFAMMRHDIDRKPESALYTAGIEAQSGIRAAYYFRRYGSAFRPEIIWEIEGMGHEVCYHHEVLGKAKGDHERAIKMRQRVSDMNEENGSDLNAN